MLPLVSSSGRFTPLSFQGFRSALKLRVDSIEIKDDFDTLLEPLKSVLAECELLLRRSKNEEMEDMLPGLRRRSNSVLRSRAASSSTGFLGDSVETEEGACCKSFESNH